jgi:hypothetical protein
VVVCNLETPWQRLDASVVIVLVEDDTAEQGVAGVAGTEHGKLDERGPARRGLFTIKSKVDAIDGVLAIDMGESL